MLPRFVLVIHYVLKVGGAALLVAKLGLGASIGLGVFSQLPICAAPWSREPVLGHLYN